MKPDNMELYKRHPKLYVAVDCVIFGYQQDELHLLLYPRGFEPSKGSWSLPGGFIQDEESADEAAARILKETTGLGSIFLQQVAAFSKPDRDPEERVISIAYYALLRIDLQDESLVQEKGARWWPVTQLPELIFDHREMIDKALLKLQQLAGYSLVGSELLPDMFTLIQLRKVYEAIFQREFDPGNFRKKILSLGILERLNEKNASESKKGAYYYRLKNNEPEQYSERIQKSRGAPQEE